MTTFAHLMQKMNQALTAMGRENSQREAIWLAEYLGGAPFFQIREQRAAKEVLQRADMLLDRLQEGEPFQYVLGEQDFYGLSFLVDPRVLIPRPETEVLVEKALSLAPPQGRILDLCCGSGCIAVALAHHLPQSEIWAVDLSSDALALAAENARRHGADIRFGVGDLFAALPPEAGRFDLIVSNPPYIPREEIGKLDPEIAYEPTMALDGGEDGLDFYRRILPDAPDHLLPGGGLLLEAGDQQSSALLKIAAACLYDETEIFSDLSGKNRFFYGRAEKE